MPSKQVCLHEAALAEGQAAYDWYASRNPAAAEAFVDELDHAIEQIGSFPGLGGTHTSGTRRYVMKRFPFTVIYRERKRIIEIVGLLTDVGSQDIGKNESRRKARAPSPANKWLHQTAARRFLHTAMKGLPLVSHRPLSRIDSPLAIPEGSDERELEAICTTPRGISLTLTLPGS